ncbi:MAG: chloride channel protein, partial [Anaerolineales bacterium]
MKKNLSKLSRSSNISNIAIALLVGISTGVGAVLFRYLIQFVGKVGYQWVPNAFPNLGKLTVVIVPAVGGLMVGLLIYFFAHEAKGHGVPEVMEAVALRGGRIRPVVA